MPEAHGKWTLVAIHSGYIRILQAIMRISILAFGDK